jgi:hypothetical protein
MKGKAPTEAARAIAVERDDERRAARVVAASFLLLFTCIFLLQLAA